MVAEIGAVRRLLSEHGLIPKKSLGQNFLISRRAAERILAAAEIGPEDLVLEVGPGLGALTLPLAERARRVIAIELDEQLLAPLRQVLSGRANVELLHGDILALDMAQLLGSAENLYKVVANLPYYATSAILRHLLEAQPRPQALVVTVQREVAERIVARPGKMSLLSVSVQFYGTARIVARISKGAFYPPPEVDSAAVRIDLHPHLPVAEGEVEGHPTGSMTPWGPQVEGFFRVVRAGFSQRRKQLRNSLAQGLGLSPEEVVAALARRGLDARRRAQSLSIEEWVEAHRALLSRTPPAP